MFPNIVKTQFSSNPNGFLFFFTNKPNNKRRMFFFRNHHYYRMFVWICKSKRRRRKKFYRNKKQGYSLSGFFSGSLLTFYCFNSYFIFQMDSCFVSPIIGSQSKRNPKKRIMNEYCTHTHEKNKTKTKNTVRWIEGWMLE